MLASGIPVRIWPGYAVLESSKVGVRQGEVDGQIVTASFLRKRESKVPPIRLLDASFRWHDDSDEYRDLRSLPIWEREEL